MVRECHYVIAETLQGIIHSLRCVVTFVEYSLHLGVGVEVGPFPCVRRIQSCIRVEDVRSREWLRPGEAVDRTHSAYAHQRKQNKQYDGQTAAGYAQRRNQQ